MIAHIRFVLILTALFTLPGSAQEGLLRFDRPADWETGPHRVAPSESRRGPLFSLRFTEDDQRLLAVQTGTRDLSEFTSFRFRVGIDRTSPLLEATLSFRSGNGWYRKGFTLSEPGLHHVLMAKAEFREEGSPAGWGAVDAVEFSFRPRHAGRVTLSSLALEAFQAPVLILDTEPLASTGDGIYTARVARRHQQRILERLGIPYALARPEEMDTLAPPDVVILPTAPVLPAKVRRKLTAWSDAGTALIVFGGADPVLAELLGVQTGSPVSSTTVGQFEKMVASTNTAGLQGEVYQHTWTFHRATPSTATVLATWASAEGAPHDLAAVLSHPRGVWVTAEWKSGDLTAKPVWMVRWLEPHSPTAIREHRRCLIETRNPPQLTLRYGGAERTAPPGRRMKQRADRLFTAGLKEPELNRSAALLRQSAAWMERSLASGPPPWPDGVRGIWEQQGTGLYAGGWDPTMQTLQSAGFNAVFANMATAGRAHYRSSLIPPSKTFETFGDQLQAFTRAARRHGLQAHAWKICWKLNTRLPAFRERLEREGRLMQDPKGNTIPWLSLSDPRNVQFEIESLLEMARSADLDGLHLDYMRYPGARADYGPAARRSFEAEIGRALPEWPQEVLGPLKEEFQRFRQQEVHRAMEAISTAVKAEFPDLILSVAVWGAWPDCAVNQGQDWPVWAARGWSDWIIPMNYTDNPDQFAGWLDLQRRQPGVAERLIPGIGLISTNAELTPMQLLDQLSRIRDRQLPGAVLYRLDASLPQRIFPYLGGGDDSDP